MTEQQAAPGAGPTSAADTTGSAPRQVRRVAATSAIGTTIEWYDFFIYATAAALVFNSQFFTTLSPASGTLAAFATLGVGLVARRSAASCGGTSATVSAARGCWSSRCC